MITDNTNIKSNDWKMFPSISIICANTYHSWTLLRRIIMNYAIPYKKRG